MSKKQRLALAAAAAASLLAGSSSAQVLCFQEEARLIDPTPPSGQSAWRMTRDGDLVGMTLSTSALFFEKQAGTWVALDRPTHPDMTAVNDVAIAGTTVFLGDSVGDAVFVFERSGTGFAFQQELTASDAGAGSSAFGWALEADGGRLVVGDSLTNSPWGAAYVFESGPSGWTEQAVVVPTSTDVSQLGTSVAVDGDRILLGAGSLASSGQGAVVFMRQGSGWVEEDRLTPAVVNPDAIFGKQVDLDGDRAAVYSDDATFVAGIGWTYPGTVHVFDRSGSTWSETAQVVPPANGSGNFGQGLSLDGDRLAIGAPAAGPVGQFVGRASLYELGGSGWTEVWSLALPDGAAADGLGYELVHHVGGLTILSRVADPQDPSNRATVFVLDEITLPQTYCTAKVNSLGCAPYLSFSAPPQKPSATSAGPFDVVANDVLNNRNGLLFYGVTGATALPFFGGTLCALPPLRRTAFQNAFGNPPPVQDCSGSYAFDFNAWIQGGSDPALVAGQDVFAQYWTRDPNQADGTGIGLTDAVRFGICP